MTKRATKRPVAMLNHLFTMSQVNPRSIFLNWLLVGKHFQASCPDDSEMTAMALRFGAARIAR